MDGQGQDDGVAASLSYIKEAVDRNYDAILRLNGDVDDVKIAVECEKTWREGHRETHDELNRKIKILSGVYGAITVVTGYIGARFGNG